MVAFIHAVVIEHAEKDRSVRVDECKAVAGSSLVVGERAVVQNRVNPRDFAGGLPKNSAAATNGRIRLIVREGGVLRSSGPRA